MFRVYLFCHRRSANVMLGFSQSIMQAVGEAASCTAEPSICSIGDEQRTQHLAVLGKEGSTIVFISLAFPGGLL